MPVRSRDTKPFGSLSSSGARPACNSPPCLACSKPKEISKKFVLRQFKTKPGEIKFCLKNLNDTEIQ